MKNLSEEEQKKLFKIIKEKRYKGKTTNFSSIYGVGAEKLARELGCKISEAKNLLISYWKRNKAVKDVADGSKVININRLLMGKKWIFNPVSQFWYSLRAEKDRFSTLNQSTGVYCFDQWIKRVRKKGIIINLQMHDEILFSIKKRSKEEVERMLREAIEETNNFLKLNVPLNISIEFGDNYAEVH